MSAHGFQVMTGKWALLCATATLHISYDLLAATQIKAVYGVVNAV